MNPQIIQFESDECGKQAEAPVSMDEQPGPSVVCAQFMIKFVSFNVQSFTLIFVLNVGTLPV